MAKPWPKLIITFCQLDLQQYILIKFYLTFKSFQRKLFFTNVCKMSSILCRLKCVKVHTCIRTALIALISIFLYPHGLCHHVWARWCHDMHTLSTSLALCVGNPSVCIQWIPSTKATNAELWWFLCCQPHFEQTVKLSVWWETFKLNAHVMSSKWKFVPS